MSDRRLNEAVDAGEETQAAAAGDLQAAAVVLDFI